ncbi:MAG: hypothetical protein QM611_04695 [Microbacterium sp.]|uniref:glycerophosphoryl diester phosphodiesterase membrane domain-containing protein n=1 Tax=Microbacterium sp. TaxID=51671 RepID=UPI0039E2D7D8
MSAQSGWRPASRPGIVPLHPLGFGTILGRSFTALRQNPKVLLGFALCVQTVAYLILLVAVGGVAIWAFSRLDTLIAGSDEYNAVMAGAIALTSVTAVVFGLLLTALTVAVQGVVIADVSGAVVAEKRTLRQLWTRVKPAVWRLLGYTLLVTLAVLVVLGPVTLALVALGVLGGGALALAIVLGVVLFIALIPLSLWLTVKLLLVPAVLVLEHATIRGAVARSWTLVRGRFWSTLGIIVIISLAIGVAAQLVSVPFSILTAMLGVVIDPNGADAPSAVIAAIITTVLAQAVTLLVEAMGIVIQATATCLVYVDCRMRHEGLDLDLLAYVEKRDAGGRDLTDPYTPHPDRPHPPRPQYAPAPGGYPMPGYPQPAPYPQPGRPPYAGYPQPVAQPAPPQQPSPPQQPGAASPRPPATQTPPPPPSTQWAAPGGGNGQEQP